MVDLDELSATFSALADPTRRAILARLAAEGERSVTELAEPFDVSLMAVSKHVQVLERARLVVRRRDAQRRPVRIDPQRIERASTWMRRFWDASFDRLDDYLKSQKKKRKRNG